MSEKKTVLSVLRERKDELIDSLNRDFKITTALMQENADYGLADPTNGEKVTLMTNNCEMLGRYASTMTLLMTILVDIEESESLSPAESVPYGELN